MRPEALSTAYWCERALVGDPAKGRFESGVVVSTDGELIAAVAAADPPPRAVRLSGIVIPGLVDSHSHAFHRALRGVGVGDDFFSWREEMYALADRLDPDNYRELAAAVFSEMLAAGITTVGEFHYLHRRRGGGAYGDENAMANALVEAAARTGIRLCLIDACYLHGGIGTAPEGAQRRFADASVDEWVDRLERLELAGGRLAVACHSARALEPDELRDVAAYARSRAVPLHFHLAEMPAEGRDCEAAYGRSPTRLFADAGALGPASVAVHATHLSADDRRLLGETRTAVCLCPTTERDLGDGVGQASQIAASGSPLCLGSDANAAVDMFEEARLVELDERLVAHRRRIHPPGRLLAAATSAGAAALGVHEGGRIEAGALCDLVAVSPDSPRLAGARDDHLLDALVFSASPADVTDVVVAGRHLVDGRRTERDRELAVALSAAVSAVRGDR